ncbi:MAG TPA: NAD-dependent epimerase/dehydratase family protein [Acidobacteriota bacterium]|nr:NAD-dependent epimerase/dehydratase family protein [Acidobacteriota bacterium]
MKIIITGAAGFIGSHLSERLISQGHTLIGIDSFLDYYPRWVKEMNVAELQKNSSFRLIERNILDLDWNTLLEDVDIVIHLAAQAGVRASWGQSFLIYTKNNIEATQLMLEASKEKKLKKFVFASTSSVYGDTDDIPMRENSLVKPVSPYGVTKLAAEGLCNLYYKNYGVPCVSLRYFTVYGPRQRPDMAFYRFILALLEDRSITIFEDGNQTRDFTFIDDIVTGTELAAMKGVDGRIYNLGGGSRITVNDAIEKLGQVAGRKLKVNYADKQKGDMRHTFASTEQARTDLGYVPETKLDEGLEQEFRWLENLYRRGLTHRAN